VTKKKIDDHDAVHKLSLIYSQSLPNLSFLLMMQGYTIILSVELMHKY